MDLFNLKLTHLKLEETPLERCWLLHRNDSVFLVSEIPSLAPFFLYIWNNPDLWSCRRI
jgi:hypothetical protein